MNFAYENSDPVFKKDPMRICVIGNKNEFVVRSMICELESKNFLVNAFSPDVSEVAKMHENTCLCLLIVEHKPGIEPLLIYLRDLCYDKSLRVCIICPRGDDTEIGKSFPLNDITKIFFRPVNIKEVGAELQEVYKQAKNESRKRNILMIDDDPTYLRNMQSILKPHYRVYIVTSGAAAIKVLATHPIDLILLDYEMPIIDGPHVFQMIKAESEYNTIPIMFLSGHTDVESVKKACLLRPDKFLSKLSKGTETLNTIDEFFAYNSGRSMLK